MCNFENNLNIYLKFDVHSSLKEIEKLISATRPENITISILLHLTPREILDIAVDWIRVLKSSFMQIKVGISAVEVDQLSDAVLGLVDIVQVPVNPLDIVFQSA